MTDLDKLVSEFAADFESGRDPDPGKFLSQADLAERRELANRLDAYLDTAPPQKWDPGAYERSPARVAAERVFESLEGEAGSWPELLPRLRERARIQREELTRRLAEALGFGGKGEITRVHTYYHQMEHGQIPASGVSDKVLAALAGLLGTSSEALRTAGDRVSGADASGQISFARKATPAPQYRAEGSFLSDYAAPPPAAADVGSGASGFTSGGGESRKRSGRDSLDELFLGPEA